MSSVSQEAKTLFLECFDSKEDDAETVLGFASEFGRVSLRYAKNKAASMICSAEIKDGDFRADYIFACCTSPEFRNRGLFKAHLDEIVGEKPVILIPERDELFKMYEHLGFEPIYHLEAEFFGNRNATDLHRNVTEIFSLYQNSNVFPKKSKALFDASLKAFLSYGGEIKEKDGTVMLVNGRTVTEIFAKTEENAINAAKDCFDGRFLVMFPLSFEAALKNQNIKYEKKSIAMAKNLNPLQLSQIYFNNLFN